MKTSGNTALITGGGTGIGFALAEALILQGNNVVICGRRLEKLRAAKKKFPALHIRVCDVSKAASRVSLARWLRSRFPSLNLLVNNAGVQRVVDFRKGKRDLEKAHEELATNLAAPIHLTVLLIPQLRNKRQSAIVNVSSGLAFTPLAAVPVYCATEAALHSFSLSLRHQLRNTSVRVFEIAPPIVSTELAGRRQRPDDVAFTTSPQQVAAGILEALKNETYLGAAARLREEREAMFEAIKDTARRRD